MLSRFRSPLSLFFGWLPAILVLAARGNAHACAVCFGAPDDQVVGAMTVAILAMLAVLTGVLGSFVGFFIYLNRHSR